MLDTWKDWTGARYIYMYLPDDLGLRRISLYHRQYPDDLNLFMYVVLVECHGITNEEKLVSFLRLGRILSFTKKNSRIFIFFLLGSIDRFRSENEIGETHRLRVSLRGRKICFVRISSVSLRHTRTK